MFTDDPSFVSGSILTPPSLEVKFEYQQSGRNKRGIQTYYLSTWCIFNGCINYTVYYINLHFDTRQGECCCPKCLIDTPVFILRRFYPSIDNENQVPIIFSVVLVNIYNCALWSSCSMLRT